MATWWFVRHGLAGHHDSPLTPKGEAQARALRTPLADLSPHHVATSDLSRAWRTAQIAWGERTPVTQHAALRERHLGAFETQPMRALRAQGHMNALLTWTGRPPGGESQRDLAVRVLAWLAANDDGRDTLLFVHGGLIRVVVGIVDGTEPERIGLWKVKNTEVVERTVPPGRWSQLLAELP